MPSVVGFVALALGVVLGSTLNAAAGFGFSLLTVPLMALVIGPKEAVVLSAVMSVGSNGTVAWQSRGDIERGIGGRLLGGALLGMPVGLVALSKLDAKPLQVLIGVAVLASAGVLALGIQLHRPNSPTDGGVRFVSGMFMTSVSVSGPPVVINVAVQATPGMTTGQASAIGDAAGSAAYLAWQAHKRRDARDAQEAVA